MPLGDRVFIAFALDTGSGGGIMTIGGTVTITDTVIDGNEAVRAGGGIEIIAGTVNLNTSDLTDNDVSAGGNIGTSSPGNGGGLHVTLDANLYEELEIDSIDAVDLLVQLKEMTGKKIPPEKFKDVRTIQDVLNALAAL